jgi:hypothetical protein
MRKPQQIAVDRALLLYVLHLAEPHGLLSDVKLQQLCFLCELQTFGKGFKGFHFEFFRFAYGAFSKDLDNDLTSLRRKERVENFTLSDQAREEVIPLIENGVSGVETNEKVIEILRAVVATYGPQDSVRPKILNSRFPSAISYSTRRCSYPIASRYKPSSCFHPLLWPK